jgi:hypothetical protein
MDDKAMDELSAAYIKIRFEREALKQDYEGEDTKLSEQMDEIEGKMLEVLNSANASSISTNNAVVMRKVVSRYNPTNWDAVYEMVVRHKAFGVLQKRVHDTNMRQFLEEHPDEYPAGLNVDRSYQVVVRRKSTI